MNFSGLGWVLHCNTALMRLYATLQCSDQFIWLILNRLQKLQSPGDLQMKGD